MKYSNPISKKQAIEFYVNCFSGLTKDQKELMIEAINENITDVRFLKDFNQSMNLRLRIYAPEMYQIVYEQ